MPELRPTTITDLPAVETLLAASYPRLLAADYPPSVLVTALPRIVRAQPALLASGTYYAVMEGAEARAAGGFTLWAPGGQATATPGLGHIRHVAAHPDHLRRGYARRVMDHAIGTARQMGLRRLECLSTRTAVPFYGALGFQTIEAVDVPLADGVVFPSVRMTLDL
ncbi:N-acetyltransferase [Jannaschia pagri]|uniref:N-acetyltransferase n=1 Tax=Jannaschia pagri TaxID=2829797 RepID=A0ABQ4NJS1_9RHOB|nr:MULTISPECIES: GNAT family N-acetyltransferase [unclassified Jannaschia]GIT90759.1 N-acetyltransferase [Jannaschia sp. AI_61]GIT94591.1 N-acetyltransferase [Jannaschia sp. AI_62]